MKTQALDTILDPALGLDILPADPDFPQLNIACDRERMLDVFRTHLKPASEKSYAILDCTPFRFRCRQATSRCVLQYTLRLLEPGTGRVRKLSVTGLIYAQDGAAERVWQEMQADNPRREIPDSWLTFEPVCFIPELKMVVEVFPFDRRLRVLPRFMAGPVSQLEPLLLARFGPGEWRVEERDVQPARYRTEIGVVLRYTFKARNTATAVRQMRCFYVKIYRENRGAETFQLLQSLCARPEEEQKKFTVVQPVAWLEGPTAHDLIKDGRGARAGELAAHWIRRAASLTMKVGPPLGAAQLVDRVRAGAAAFGAVDPAMGTAALAVADVLVRTQPKERDPHLVHGTLYARHVLDLGDGPGVIDWQRFGHGPVELDAGMFLATIARVGLDHAKRAGEAARAEEAFLAGTRGLLDERSLGWHRAAALFQLAARRVGHPERHNPGRWRERIQALLDEAARHAGATG